MKFTKHGPSVSIYAPADKATILSAGKNRTIFIAGKKSRLPVVANQLKLSWELTSSLAKGRH